MGRVLVKKCAFCNNGFDIKKSVHRIVLEFRDKRRSLRREYFCSRECFKDYIKKQGL